LAVTRRKLRNVEHAPLEIHIRIAHELVDLPTGRPEHRALLRDERLDHVAFAQVLRHVRPPRFENPPQLDPAWIALCEKSLAMEKGDLVPIQVIRKIRGAL